jgi:hypothetical protein
LPATDDVSIPRSRCEKVGRRGLAGNVISECLFSILDFLELGTGGKREDANVR